MRRGGSRLRALSAAAAVFVAATVWLGAAELIAARNARAQAEADRVDSTRQIIAKSGAAGQEAPVDRWGAQGLIGRYRLGPEQSPLRVVMLTDYQCPDCRRIEGELDQIRARHPELAVSIKYFPMCKEAETGVPCNKYVSRTLHPNACWAARAAETAGILGGDDGFWRMHRWLFAHSGSFTNEDLMQGLHELGFDSTAFIAVMRSPETLKRVQADVEDGHALGLFFTPMIFVNGVEFRGWQVPGALTRTIDQLAATHPPALTSAADRPVLAARKYIDDWRQSPLLSLAAGTVNWSMRADKDPGGAGLIDIVLFGDYLEPFTSKMDIAIRDRVSRTHNVRYTFRNYPIEAGCNPVLPPKVRPEAIHPGACRAAEAAMAAGSVGGSEAFWKMHDWLMRHQKAASDDSLRAAAQAVGIDPGALLSAMDKPEVAAAIAQDARAGEKIGLTAVPTVLVNGRNVPRTDVEGDNIVLRILDDLGVK